MLPFLVTPCLVVAVQPCMERLPIKKKKKKKKSFTKYFGLLHYHVAIFCFSNENTLASENIIKKLMTIFNDFFEETKNLSNSCQLKIERNSRSQMFFKIGVLGVLDLKACKFIKKRLQHRCFAVKFANFFRKPFLLNTSSGCF